MWSILSRYERYRNASNLRCIKTAPDLDGFRFCQPGIHSIHGGRRTFANDMRRRHETDSVNWLKRPSVLSRLSCSLCSPVCGQPSITKLDLRFVDNDEVDMGWNVCGILGRRDMIKWQCLSCIDDVLDTDLDDDDRLTLDSSSFLARLTKNQKTSEANKFISAF